METPEQRVLAAIDVEGMLEALCELIAVRSPGGEETPAQELMAAQMAACGLEVDVWELDFREVRRHPAFSAEIEREHGLGVVATLGKGTAGRDLIFNGHVDVVPAGDEAQWSRPPWRATVEGGRVYGRGAVDMKGGLCCALFAAKALRDAGVRLEGKLMIESVIGEEDGGVGTLAAILRGYRADGAVVIEPTELAVVPAQAGALNFRLTVPGVSAHGCMREEGISAIEKFFPIYAALMDLEAERNRRARHPLLARYRLPYPLSIGTVRAGEWASSVPETLCCEGRYGVAIGEDVAAARRELEEAVARAARADPWLRRQPPRLEWWGGQFEPAEVAVEDPIVRTVAEAYREISGTQPRLAGVTYGADMRLLVNEGKIPTVLFGPGDVRQAHRPDEFVPVDQLVTAAQTLALAALRFCGVAE